MDAGQDVVTSKTIKDGVLVQVFGSDLATGSCGCGPGCCGSDGGTEESTSTPSLAEQVADLESILRRYYGAQVQAEYVDIFSDDMSTYPKVFNLIAERRVRLPVVLVNGVPKFAGGLPLDGISAEIEALGVMPLADTESKD